MKAIMVMFDSLNRHFLSSYGCEWTHTPNFQRLAQRAVTFDRSCVGSMPCMPARRDMLTGRYNFLHRSWGPLEPFDDAFPEILKGKGVYTHLVTDHQHYWEDGGGTYHGRYSTHEFIRGQEGDPWKGVVGTPDAPPMHDKTLQSPMVRQDWINRSFSSEESQFPQARTFAKGIEFVRRNAQEDNWYLQIETFDPHEPFRAPERFRKLYPHQYDGPHFDWPNYGPVGETREQVEHVRFEYAALLSMCDEYLGRLLDTMDELDLWKDTLLIVNTDHGFLLGEHDEWAKCVQPFYEEVAHTPLFIWDPRCGAATERRRSLVQLIDMAPTLLDYFQIPVPADMTGKSLRYAIERDQPVREAAIFGIHGGHVNITDGRYVYMRGPQDPANAPLFNYTLMPTHMRHRFSPTELLDLTLSDPFSFTKGVKLLKISGSGAHRVRTLETMLFDLGTDPMQQSPHRDESQEVRLASLMARIMEEHDCPSEQFERLGLL